MTFREFALLVQEMRTAQSRYFRERSGDALDAARELEKRVDASTRDVLEPGLFGGIES